MGRNLTFFGVSGLLVGRLLKGGNKLLSDELFQEIIKKAD